MKSISMWIACLFFAGNVFANEPQMVPAKAIFEVKAISKNSLMIDEGNVKESKGGDQVIYAVDLPKKVIQRTAIYDTKIKEGPRAGLRSDDTIYDIVFYGHDFLTKQTIIKAIGKEGERDGFEILVIGEDFVTTVNSMKSFFQVYYYERIDEISQEYKVRKSEDSQFGKLKKWMTPGKEKEIKSYRPKEDKEGFTDKLKFWKKKKAKKVRKSGKPTQQSSRYTSRALHSLDSNESNTPQQRDANEDEDDGDYWNQW